MERLCGVPGCSRACPSPSYSKEMSIFCLCSDFAILFLTGFDSIRLKLKLTCHSSPLQPLQTGHKLYVPNCFAGFVLKEWVSPCVQWLAEHGPGAAPRSSCSGRLCCRARPYLVSAHFLRRRRGHFCQKQHKNSILFPPRL